MDETIDLRPYVDTLVRRWWVILGAVLVGVLIAAFLYFNQSNYRATALVAIVDPTQRLQFDERMINTLDLDILMQAYPEMADSDDVLAVVLAEAEALSDGAITTLPQLRELLDVETGADFRLVRLVVRHADPDIAADLANVWANAFVTITDKVYLGQSGDIQFYENQLAETESELREIEQALVEFQSGSRISIVDNQLFSLNQQQASYLADQSRLALLLDDIRALSNQIDAGEGDTITLADQLTALMLQLNVYAYDKPSISPTVVPAPSSSEEIQLLISPQVDLTTSNRLEQLSLLANLAESTEESLGELEVKLLALEPRIFSLQREKESLFHQFDELTRKRDVARETYLTLSRRIDEVRVQTEDTGSSLRIASLAEPPTEFDRSNLIVTSAIAGMVGFLLCTSILLFITWWKNSNTPAAA